MNPLSALGQIAHGIGNGIGAVGGAIGGTIENDLAGVGRYMWHPQATAQATKTMPDASFSLGVHSPVPVTKMTNQINPQYQAPIPQNQIALRPMQPSGFQNTMSAIGNFGHNVANFFGGGHPQQPLQQAVQGAQVRVPSPTEDPVLKEKWTEPEEHPLVQHAQQRFGGQPAYGQPATPNPSINPNITIPYSNGGQYTLPSGLAQTILNAFNDIHQATPAAQVLNHPANNPYLGPGSSDPPSVNNPTHGENGSFLTSNVDRTNSDGSVDRGLFRINSNTFNGMMSNPTTKQQLAKFGISDWADMEDPQKNAYAARLIYEHGGWGRWYAAPHNLRAQGPPDLEQLAKMIKK